MGCGCHAAKKVNATKQVTKKDRMLVKSVMSKNGYTINSTKKIIRRSISH